MISPPLHTRIAPTPSGYLHRGNAFSFVLTWLFARSDGGTLHLRIDDLDADRTRPEYIADVLETLAWLGLDYDTGPRSVQDFQANWSQRRRLDAYTQALEQLREQGDLFACTCSRRTEGAFSESGIYTGLCRNTQHSFSQNDVAWRFRSENASNEAEFTDIERGKIRINTSATMGDVVLRRKDGIPAYHIASLIDDELDGITFIVRGNDLLPSTAVQCALAERLYLCGFPIHSFPKVHFLHHPLLLDAEQKKLSKSHGAAPLKVFREQGGTPHEIYRSVAEYLKIPEPVQTLQELLTAFEMFFSKLRRKNIC